MTDFLAFLAIAACLVAVTERAGQISGTSFWLAAGMPGLIDSAEAQP